MKIKTLDKISCFLAELIGTALLVFLGCMGCINIPGIPNNHLQTVINFGLTVMMIVQMFGCVSGAHLNPAVTVAAFIYQLLPLSMVAVYIVAQVLGGFIGYGLLKAVVSSQALAGPGFCTTVPHGDISSLQALTIEFVITTVLIFVCCGCWDPRNQAFGDSVPIKFGLTIVALACAAGPWTGASMNPARSFGPAIWTGHWESHWIYWVGPLLAAVLGSLAYKGVFYRKPEEKVQKVKVLEELALA